MREPIGTTRKGQLLLGGLGLIVGIGSAIGLELDPHDFEPILRTVLYGLGALLRIHTHYDPSQRAFYAFLLSGLGMFWALLMGYAFARQPARDRAIDTYLRRNDGIDQSQRATVIAQNDRSV